MIPASRVVESTRVQDLVEQALDLAGLPSVVVVTDRTEANLRWANNALTTNGEMHGRTLTVTATAEVEGGTAAGTVSQAIAGADDVAAVVAALGRGGVPLYRVEPEGQTLEAAFLDLIADEPPVLHLQRTVA